VWHVWHVWHLTPGLPVGIDLALEVDLLAEAGLAHKADALFPLTKEALKRHLLDELWQANAATSPKSLAAVVLSDPVVEEIRKELRLKSANGQVIAMGGEGYTSPSGFQDHRQRRRPALR
jgi:hypothetical protein